MSFIADDNHSMVDPSSLDNLIQYRVDFKPAEDRSFIRKMLVHDFHEQLPKYLYDGSIMFTRQPLNDDKSPVVLTTRRKSDNALIQITLTEVGEDLPTDHHYKQLGNVTGPYDEMRAKFQLDKAKFQLDKAMAASTRQTPDKRLAPLKRFNDSNWRNVIQKLGLAERSCGKWAVLYPPRDDGMVKDVVLNLLKVSPYIGLVLGCPKTFKLLDDRPAVCIQQLHKTMDMGADLVMVVTPDEEGEHYNAIEKKCCSEKWQMESMDYGCKWAVMVPPRDEEPTKESKTDPLTPQFSKDENAEKLKQLEDEKAVVGCFSKFKAFVEKQWKRMVGFFGCLRPNADLEKIREKGDKESLLPGCTFSSADKDLMKASRSKLSK